MLASLYSIVLPIWIVSAIATFFLLLKVDAPFGRHSKKNWGPNMPNNWAWFIMEMPALVVMPAFYFLYADFTLYSSGDVSSFIPLFLVGLWVLHYFNRTCIFPFRIKTSGKTMPVVIALMAFFFNLTNGFLCGYYLANYADYSKILIPIFIIGLIIFIAGLSINWWSDNILISLRETSGKTAGKTSSPNKAAKEYIIPKQGLFKWVSCPNLMGEIIEWFGFAIMAGGLPFFAFALWTLANLFPRALAHHKWYQNKFSDYPKERKAVIPLII